MDKDTIKELMQFWKKPLEFMDIESFVANHNHIRYCEAIIRQDGMISYVSPSHIEGLLELTGEDREVINQKMPIWDSPIDWLVEYTKCISVWYDYMIKPTTITIEQERSIRLLMKNRIISYKEI